MKGRSLLIIAIVFLAFACNNGNENEINSLSEDSVQYVNINDLITNTNPLSDLSQEQELRVEQIHEIFKEVNPNNFDEWVAGFELDLNPVKEIDIWLNMGQTYEAFTASKELTLDQKMEAYNVVLMRSLMRAEEVIEKHENKFLNAQDINQILDNYTANPEPLNTIGL